VRRLKVLAAAGAMVLLAVVGTGGPAKAAYAGTNGRISFSALPCCAGPISTMNADGSDVQPLTSGVISDWSPDGRKIAFDDNRTGKVEVFTMNADGSDQQQVTHLGAFTGDPSWSPDGSLLVFEHAAPNGCCGNIWTIHPDGTGLHQVTHFTTENPVEPEFSPDGQQIAFFAAPRGGANLDAIFVMRADGSDIRQVTPLQMDAAHPEWSPDGSKIIFNNDFHPLPTGLTVGDIFTIRPDGTGLQRLTDVIPLGEADFRPDYSPDGTMIVFNQLVPNQHTSVLTMKANGARPKVIHANGFAPDWGPQPS
jgi:Tol biopolymer transport system component